MSLYETLKTELVGWFIVSLLLPGAIATAVLDQITPLDRGQLWAFSVACSGVIFVALVYAGSHGHRPNEAHLWYAALAISLAIVAIVLSFGFNVPWVGAFLSRFRFGPELFNLDVWIPTLIQIAITSVITLTGTVVVLLAKAAAIALSRTQVWMLALLLNAVLANGLTRWGIRRQWFLFEDYARFRQSMFEATIGGGLLVVLLNAAAMAFSCFLYFGVRVRMLADIFSQLAPSWPDWMT